MFGHKIGQRTIPGNTLELEIFHKGVQSLMASIQTGLDGLNKSFLDVFRRLDITDSQGFLWLSVQLWFEVPTELVCDFFLYERYSGLNYILS